MKLIYILFFSFFLFSGVALSQTITEKEVFNLTYRGITDAYNFRYDTNSGNYCYVYRMPDEEKSFIISGSSNSDKYDYISPEEITFDSKGNYYAVTSDYKAEYGINNYFLIVNGNVVKSYDYIEAYSSFINKKNEYVFVFKEKDQYKIGYYSPESGFRQSDAFENIRTAFNYRAASDQLEGDMISYKEDDFYHNDNGERAFIASAGGKTKIIFETSDIETDYSDINESSLTKNRNNELSFIAKKGGRFYEISGNEFVVSGNKEYRKFELTNTPLLFNDNNEPVYTAGDSISENKYEYYIVVGDQIQKVYLDDNKTVPAPAFGNIITDIKINSDGSLTYTGTNEVIIPGKKKNPADEVYDEYYSKSFLVKNGIANELGYNVNQIKYNDKGDMLYTGMADINKKDYLLMMNYGKSRIIINKKKYDEIFDYGFTPKGEIYYVGQTYEDPPAGKITEATLFMGDKRIGKYYNLNYEGDGANASVIKFDSKNNYTFAAQIKKDSVTYDNYIVTNTGKLPFPENVTKSKNISYISNLMYTKNDRIFFVGDMSVDPVTYDVTKELFIDNKTLGKTYNTIYPLVYNEEKNEINFTGSRGNKIYFVTVKL